MLQGVGVYDNSIRDLIAGEPRALAELLLGVDLAARDVRFGPTELAGSTLRTDSILEVGDRCLHVEFQLKAAPADIEQRLVAYWTRLLETYGRPPEQHVVVLNPSGGRLSGRYASGGLTLEYRAHHLWDVASETFLSLPVLYPFAVLGRTDDREAVVAKVLTRAHRARTGVARERVSRIAATLANVYLPRSTLEQLLRRADMPIDLRELPMVREAMAEGREEGRERGREEGREEGRDEGHADALVLVVTARLGELPSEIEAALRDNNRTLEERAKAVAQASSLEDLRAQLA